MGLTTDKVLYGPYTLTILDGATTNFQRTALKADSIKYKVETKEATQEIEDGKEKFWYNGRKLTIEAIFSEMDPTATTGDLAKIEDSGNDTVTILLTELSKTITIASPDKIFTHIDENFKTRIVIYKTGDIASTMADLMSVA